MSDYFKKGSGLNFETDSAETEEELLEAQKKKKAAEFAQLLDASFKSTRKTLSAGEKIKAEVLSMGKDEIFVSTGTMHDGLVPRKDLLDADGKLTCKVGDILELYVTHSRGSEIYLSPKPTSKNIADSLEDAFDMELPVEGRVTEVCKGGFRVSVSGKSAFCPISQMDSKRIETPEDYVGQRYEFRITQFSEGGRNIVVSRRKLLDEQKGISESSFMEERKPGEIVKGKVTRLEKFGAFVELSPGMDGLIHISELAWSRVGDPQEVVRVGQEVHVKILRFEEIEGRLKISLSLKQAGAEPWDNLPVDVKPGHVVDGKVTRCMKFGAFVEIAPGLEGLVPLSEMSYTKRVVRSDELFKEGDRITVMIKEMNSSDRKILLSLKDAGGDPWAMVPQKFPVGAIVKGKVERREPYGLFVRLDEGVVALLPKSKAAEDSAFPYERLKVGDETTVQIGELRQEERRISLCVPSDEGRDDWKGFAQPSSTSFGTLGDQFRKALEGKPEKKSKK